MIFDTKMYAKQNFGLINNHGLTPSAIRLRPLQGHFIMILSDNRWILNHASAWDVLIQLAI